MEKKLAVIFPGVGYHSDKPLLYYSKKLAKNHGYEIKEVKYTFSKDIDSIKTHAAQAEAAINEAMMQVVEQLKDVDFSSYDNVVFIGKSIGTAIAAKYAFDYGIDAESIVFTPIEMTFAYINACEGFVFHGSEDPLCDTDMCVQLCDELSITYAVIPDANHSLETGNVDTDIQNLHRIMKIVDGLF
ncbi:Alpha/beta hydrolase family protein [Pseudobutyrivibrio sp. C4]|uniref:hypothetical protein n=1 Tax=Pseudobutyrivibrio sp. C4 TaxID=1520803 RepID=UPI0008BEE23F|nr:hypothetical protein [Pseudobutyrivibrio sp. C4]SES92970.1 Alpha/beta hydrolase family protein [Pseudobutyrivibrio sp. C4]